MDSKSPSILQPILTGFVMGDIGALVGWYPGVLLHEFLASVIEHYTVPGTILHFAGTIFPIYAGSIVYLSVVGAASGILGALIGYQRRSPLISLWGFVAGLLVNVFFEFTFTIL